MNSVSMSKFITYEDKSDTSREFFISGTIFSGKLDELLEAFDERIITNNDFIKIKEKDKSFLEKIKKDRKFKKFKKSKRNRNIKPSFHSTIEIMLTLRHIADEETENVDEYDKLLSKIIPNLESTVENLEIIEAAIETIEKSV